MHQLITSLANPRIKTVVKLRSRRTRNDLKLTLVDGTREIYRAAISGFNIKEVYLSKNQRESKDATLLLNCLQKNPQTETYEVNQTVMEKIAFGNRDEGAVAVIEYPERSLNSFEPDQSSLIVVIEGIEKPGNVGAILRTADAVKADCLMSVDGRTDIYNPNAIRASLGAIFHVPIYETTSQAAINFLVSHQISIFAARVDGAEIYHQQNYRGPTAIVLGSEAEGLTEQWNLPEVNNIFLPMRGIADSLNVSTSAAVLLYEVLRQRNH